MPEIPETPEELPLVDEAGGEENAVVGEAPASAEICGGTPTSQNRDMGHPLFPQGLKPGTLGGADGGTEVPPLQNETTDFPETAKENEPMIDIHVPQATHTWKDFWIHLGTIAAGLLIAISLEQSVEKLHQLHQRHELEAALQAEGEFNKSLSEVNFGAFDDSMTWRLGLHQDIQTMLSTGGKANLPYRVQHRRTLMLNGRPSMIVGSAGLSTAVWGTAAEDNRLTLLPDDLATAYSRIYHEGEDFADARRVAFIAEDQQSTFEGQFAEVRTPRTPVLAKMNAAQLQQYDALVMQVFTDVRREKAALTTFYGSNNAALDGTLNLVRGQREAKAAYPDDYDKMAQEIEAEDAARDKAAVKAAEKGK